MVDVDDGNVMIFYGFIFFKIIIYIRVKMKYIYMYINYVCFYRNIYKINWILCKDVWLEIRFDGLILLILDIDECVLGIYNCFNGYECLNIEGLFRCR